MIRVLYADDEPALLDTGRLLLGRSGDLDVTTASSGAEALRLFEDRHFDVIVSGNHVPEMDGVALLARVRELDQRIPFILFAGRDREEALIRALDNRADFCLLKGDDPRARFGELEQAIRAVTLDEQGKAQGENLPRLHDGLVAALQGTRENERRYRAVYNGLPDALLLFEEGRITDCNAAALGLFGVSSVDALAGKTVLALSPPLQPDGRNSADPLQELLSRVPENGAAYFHWVFRKIDGTPFTAQVRLSPVELPRRTGIQARIRDISVRRDMADEQQQKLDRAVRYQKALLQLATSGAPSLRAALNRITETGSAMLNNVSRVSIWFFSPDGNNLICNDLFIQGRKIHEYGFELSRQDYPVFFAALQERRAIAAVDAGKNKDMQEFISSYLDPLGIVSTLDIPIRTGMAVIGVLRFEQTGSPRTWDIVDQDFAIALADYTALVLEQARRRLAEKDLRRSEQKYRAVVDRANDGIVIIQEGLLQFINPKAAAILGATPRDLQGIPFLDLVIPAEQENVRERDRRRNGGEEIPPVYETRLHNRQGNTVDVELNAGFMEFNGKPSELVFIRDISDRKRSEQALRLANLKLNLLSSVTRHDILNKLTIAIGYIELAKVTQDREKLDDFIQKIDATLQIVENQIQFTRDYQDMGVKEPEWQDAAVVFDQAISQLDSGDIRIQNRLSGLSIYADPLLGKVLYNIADNALRYGENLTSITASYRNEDGAVILTVEDNGIGIPVKNKSRIFDKGFGQHTGLGLFLAKEILSLTGIDIMETGFPTKGARFEILIPHGRYRLLQKGPGS